VQLLQQQLIVTKDNVNSLTASTAGLSAELAGKQNQLTPGTVAGGHQLLQNGVVRAIKGSGPLKVAADTNHVEVWLDQNELAATAAIATLQTSVAGKQSQLTPGTVVGGHQMLQNGVVRAIKALSPLQASVDAEPERTRRDPRDRRPPDGRGRQAGRARVCARR
jgi:hypothetical protein